LFELIDSRRIGVLPPLRMNPAAVTAVGDIFSRVVRVAGNQVQ
jgi:hypothetical protein